MPPTTETELKELRDLLVGLREEMRLGFSEIKNEIQRVEGKADIKFAELSGKIDVLEERTKLGFWGFVGRAVTISILGALALAAVSFALYGPAKIKP